MQYFLDSAKVDEIAYAIEHIGIDGVTTNPRHIKDSGKPLLTVIKEIAALAPNAEWPISVEIDPHLTSYQEMVEAGKRVAGMSPNFVVKLPGNEAGCKACRELRRADIRTNVTLIFTPMQALHAGRNGATYVSPFVGWKETNGEDISDFIPWITDMYKNYGYTGKTKVLVAAVRNGYQIAHAARAGADVVTAGLSVYKDSFLHPYHDKGLGIFCRAWEETPTGEPS